MAARRSGVSSMAGSRQTSIRYFIVGLLPLTCPTDPQARDGHNRARFIRVMSLILVLTDSMSPLLSGGRGRRGWRADAVRGFAAEAAAGGPGQPPAQGVFGFFAVELEDRPQAFFEEVGAVQVGVGFGDPGELGGLAGGEVSGVLPQCVPGSFEVLGRRGTDRRTASPAVVLGECWRWWWRGCPGEAMGAGEEVGSVVFG